VHEREQVARLEWNQDFSRASDDLIYRGGRQHTGLDTLRLCFAGLALPESMPPSGPCGKSLVAIADANERHWQQFTAHARQNGVRHVFLVPDIGAQAFSELRQAEVSSGPRPDQEKAAHKDPVSSEYFLMSPELAAALFGVPFDQLKTTAIRGRRRRAHVGLPSPMVRLYATPAQPQITAENVIGFLEGKDKKHETVVISAHYDHVGTVNGVLHPGADDNASGTAALLEIAQAFALAGKQGQGPRRNLLFVGFDGEEIGLLGSAHYTKNPAVPLDNTIAALNIDMLGRIDETHADRPRYVYVIGSDKISSELHIVNEQANSTFTHLELDYTYNADSDPNRLYYRSDQYHFAEHNIPVIFYFSGLHPDYHRPGDTADKIEYTLLAERTRLIFHTAWELANRENAPLPDKADTVPAPER
jgi:hypothetical protein